MAGVTLVSLFPFFVLFGVLAATWAVFSFGIVLALRDRRKEPPGQETPVVVVLLVGLAATTAVAGASASYVAANPVTFHYALTIQGKGTSLEAVVVPMPNDESLLAGLQVTAGHANWTFVDTPNGRGLYVAFTGPASLESDVAIVPATSPGPNSGPTLEAPYVASVSDYGWWVFYSGEAGGTLTLTLGCYTLQTSLVRGWSTAAPSCPNPQLPPLA